MIYKDRLEVMKRLVFLIFASLIFCGCRYEIVNLPGMPYASEPKNAEWLYEVDGLALFAGETESDIAFNKSNDWLQRNSLFMRRRMESGREEWRLVMTAEGDIIELQATGEGRPFSVEEHRKLLALCRKGNAVLTQMQRRCLGSL